MKKLTHKALLLAKNYFVTLDRATLSDQNAQGTARKLGDKIGTFKLILPVGIYINCTAIAL
jgi:hypothetical protein